MAADSESRSQLIISRHRERGRNSGQPNQIAHHLVEHAKLRLKEKIRFSVSNYNIFAKLLKGTIVCNHVALQKYTIPAQSHIILAQAPVLLGEP